MLPKAPPGVGGGGLGGIKPASGGILDFCSWNDLAQMRGEVGGLPPPLSYFLQQQQMEGPFFPLPGYKNQSSPNCRKLFPLNFKIIMLSICTCSWDYCWIRNKRPWGQWVQVDLASFISSLVVMPKRLGEGRQWLSNPSSPVPHPSLVWAWQPKQRWPQAGPGSFSSRSPAPNYFSSTCYALRSVWVLELGRQEKGGAIYMGQASVLLSNSISNLTWIEEVLPTAYEFVIPLPVWTVSVRHG